MSLADPATNQADLDVKSHAEALAECALEVIARRFPHKLDHLILDADDHALPQAMHPVFDGCFDWHSSVHMHWSLLRLRALAPELDGARTSAAAGSSTATVAAIAAHFDSRFLPGLVVRELDYLRTPGRASFERPYGWAWLLKLQSELEAQRSTPTLADGATRWADALRPLAAEVARRLEAFLEQAHYPVRAGTHANSAFAMLLAHDYALGVGDESLLRVLERRALAWFGGDRAYPAGYEPSGTDFLSPGLCEALLMQRLADDRFAEWWRHFEPTAAAFARWESPAIVSDRADAQLVHLDGLNLSRAWCLRALAERDAAAPTPAFSPSSLERIRRAAEAHWRAAWPHVTTGDFVATHWLVSFALLR